MGDLERIFSLFPQFFPPFLSWSYLRALLIPARETVEMAAGAMVVAIAIGLLAGIWVAAGLPGGRIVYALLTAIRSIPDLTLAILCVVVVGIGPSAGMIALAIFYSAAAGKVFSDLFLSADIEPIDALRATGAGRLAVTLFGQLPLRLNDILSYGAFEFECAARASVIIGAVGGGGLGTEIIGTINILDYHRTTTLILVLITLIAVIDRTAQAVKRKPVILWLILLLGILALRHNRPPMFAAAHAVSRFAQMLPPELPSSAIQHLPRLVLETLEIALGGTLIAVIFALPLALCSARNLAPALIAIPVRRCLEALRAVPEVVWGLIFVSAAGVGPQAGVIALALHSTGSLGRLFAESFENIPTAPVNAVAATGAPGMAIAGFVFVPLALPPMAIHTLFRLEWNVRAAAIVGLIGAGGIGQALFNAMQLFFYKQMAAYIVITGALVWLVDAAGQLARRSVLRHNHPRMSSNAL
jgi:phosphonate transport system permease protein